VQPSQISASKKGIIREEIRKILLHIDVFGTAVQQLCRIHPREFEAIFEKTRGPGEVA
jgi:hypothetical protein